MDFIYEKLRAGTTSANSDSGSEVARKFNDNFEKASAKFLEIDQTIQEFHQADVIEIIRINGQNLPITDKAVDIPLATALTHGVVKGTDAENGVSVKEDGTMEINQVNINKLVQTDGDSIILHSGDSFIE